MTMKKLLCCFSLLCAGLMVSCVDKNELVDEDSKPSWLGGSIYDELKSPSASSGLEGTFTTYLRLVDDLGYAETLSRTGSKTVFAANDSAFSEFFKSNDWGVSSYEDLTDSQKKMLLYYSMLDNALLVDMLSNTSASDGVASGNALKHKTSLSVTDTITTYSFGGALMSEYANNKNFTSYPKGMSVVCDATKPMLVHFTRDYMLNNSITTTGSGSDFSILMGQDYNSGDAYVLRNKIVHKDVTCINGYIHQVENVVAAPGNMAQVISKDPEMSIFKRLMNRFAVPVYNSSVTNDFHDWYTQQLNSGIDMSKVYNPDSIYEIRYLSELSQDGAAFKYGTEENYLKFDPAWNEYYVSASSSSGTETSLNEIAAMFVPDDNTMTEYFLNGEGVSIMDRYAPDYLKPVTAANLKEATDSIPMSVVSKLLSNMMQKNFTNTVPSKFSSIADDAADLMGATIDDVRMKNGSYDIRIANNGVIYVMNKVYSPKSYVCVSAPATFATNMKIMDWMIQNKSYRSGSANAQSLDVDFYAYLLAMSSNFAVFLPTDEAFAEGYVDPATLAYSTPHIVKYKYDTRTNMPYGEVYAYDPETGEVGETLLQTLTLTNASDMAIAKKQLVDILNYHTVVLNNGDSIGNSGMQYYKTKQGGEIKIDKSSASSAPVGWKVGSDVQISTNLPSAATITERYKQENGKSYAIDRLIQGPTQSIYSVLSKNSQFSEFFDFCDGFGSAIDGGMFEWLGITTTKSSDQPLVPADAYKVFYKVGEYESSNSKKECCLDNNIKFLSNYNYTVYAPNNDAMQIAYSKGLPKWSDLEAEYESLADSEEKADSTTKARFMANINAMIAFVKYHFQNTSVYADNTVESGEYTTFLTNSSNISKTLSVSGGNGKIYVTDGSGDVKTIDKNGSLLVNKMTRDFEFDANKEQATYVKSSSFAVVHELSTPLYYNSAKQFGAGAEISAKPHRVRR